MSSRNKEEAAMGCNGPFPNAGQSTTLQQGFGKFYKCSKFSDITLVDAGRNRIAAHRLVLSAGSKRFDELLQQEKGKEGGEIECIDVDPSCLYSMLEYLYTSNCDIQIHNAVRLLAAALLYGCHDLENMSNLFIHIHLNSSTCCFFFSEAQKHHVEHISIKCTCIASLDFNSVMRTPSFCNLTVEELMALLGSAKLGALPKLLLYKAGCAWMMQDVCRLGKFKDVLLCIQMGGQSPEELENFFNGSQGPEAQQLGYLEGHTVDSSSTTGLDLARAASAQSAIQCPRLTSFPAAHNSNFEGRLNNVGSVTSNVKSDATTETHLESTEPSVTDAVNTAINVALYTDQIGYPQKTNNSRCTTNSRNADIMTTSDSMPSEKAEIIQGRSPTSEITVIQKPRTQRTRGGNGKGKKGQPHTCQVEGCTNDLTGLKEYHNRYKICNYHLKVNSIIKDGQPQRFCQQCGRFHLLSEFDNKKRSCRARLLRHNERRRKRLKNGSKMTKPGTFISFPSSGISPQHLLYLPHMNPMKTSDAQTANVESFLKNDTGVPARCVQFLPADMERCFMLSTMDSATDQSPSNAAKVDRTNGVVKHNQNSDNIHGSTSNHHPDVKP